MRVLVPSLVEASRMLSDEDGWIWLYELEVPTTPPQRYRLAGHRTPVAFGTNSSGEPLIYSPAPILHSPIEQNSDGELPKIQLQVSNANRAMMPDLEDFSGLVDVPITIRIVHRTTLDDEQAQVLIEGQVTGTTATAERVAFDVGVQNLISFALPTQRYMKFHCRHTYGDDLCGAPVDNATFLAALPACARTREACDAVGAEELALGLPVLHPLRWGAFPGIPRQSAR